MATSNKDGITDYVFILESKEKYKIPDDFMNKEYSYRILALPLGKRAADITWLFKTIILSSMETKILH